MRPATKTSPADLGHPPLVVLRLRPVIELTADQLLELSSLNKDLRLELTAKGELVVMPPEGSETGERNMELAGQLWAWTRQSGTGVAFGSSTGFTLPNGAVRSPDASWVERVRIQALSAEQYRKCAPLCPDFVIELLSPSDSLRVTQEKMQEYLENGAKLGWLLDPQQRKVHVYKPGEPVRVLNDPDSVSAEPVLPGFVLDLKPIWGFSL
jgi:Uma2 family endonuclease